MAKFYAKLKSLELTYESKPIECLTKQKWNETLFLIHGKDEGIPAWHYILVPHNQINKLKNQKSGDIIDCTLFGSLIQYRDNYGKICSSSGWGIHPPRIFRTWIEDHYGDRPFDENTKFEYEKDDIRLCRIQRLIPSQLIGIYRYYNNQGHFHYIKLFENSQTTLAYRSGIQNYDRFIYLNGINIENDTIQQITKRFQEQLHLPLEILVSNPSTYHYYKTNHLIIHPNLPTVQHLKPVFDISLSNENLSLSINKNNYCIIQWENSDINCIVPQSSVFKSIDLIKINDICFIEYEGKYKKGIIRFIGTKDQCNYLINNISIQEYSFNYQIHSNIKSKLDKINSDKTNLLENLPNEIFYDLFNYLNLEELHYCFYNLNQRINNLLFKRSNISFIYNDNINSLIIKYYQNKIKHLIINSSKQFYLNLFNNLNSLIIKNRNIDNIKQIKSDLFPNIIYLSFKLKSNFKIPEQLINEIFSNQFKYLRYINLSFIEKSCLIWQKCPSINYLSIHCNELNIIEDILESSPNLKYFQIHFLYNSNILIKNVSFKYNFSIEKLILWSEEFELRFILIDYLFNLMPNIKYLFIQTKISQSFIYFIENLSKKLNYLICFHCFIKEFIIKKERIGNLNDIHKISSIFQSIELIKENDIYRIFATD